MDNGNSEDTQKQELDIRREGLDPRGSVTWVIERVCRNREFNMLYDLKDKEIGVEVFKQENVRYSLENERMKILMLKKAQDQADVIFESPK